jgi:hypothetical protein
MEQLALFALPVSETEAMDDDSSGEEDNDSKLSDNEEEIRSYIGETESKKPPAFHWRQAAT